MVKENFNFKKKSAKSVNISDTNWQLNIQPESYDDYLKTLRNKATLTSAPSDTPDSGEDDRGNAYGWGHLLQSVKIDFFLAADVRIQHYHKSIGGGGWIPAGSEWLDGCPIDSIQSIGHPCVQQMTSSSKPWSRNFGNQSWYDYGSGNEYGYRTENIPNTFADCAGTFEQKFTTQGGRADEFFHDPSNCGYFGHIKKYEVEVMNPHLVIQFMPAHTLQGIGDWKTKEWYHKRYMLNRSFEKKMMPEDAPGLAVAYHYLPGYQDGWLKYSGCSHTGGTPIPDLPPMGRMNDMFLLSAPLGACGTRGSCMWGTNYFGNPYQRKYAKNKPVSMEQALIHPRFGGYRTIRINPSWWSYIKSQGPFWGTYDKSEQNGPSLERTSPAGGVYYEFHQAPDDPEYDRPVYPVAGKTFAIMNQLLKTFSKREWGNYSHAFQETEWTTTVTNEAGVFSLYLPYNWWGCATQTKSNDSKYQPKHGGAMSPRVLFQSDRVTDNTLVLYNKTWTTGGYGVDDPIEPGGRYHWGMYPYGAWLPGAEEDPQFLHPFLCANSFTQSYPQHTMGGFCNLNSEGGANSGWSVAKPLRALTYMPLRTYAGEAHPDYLTLSSINWADGSTKSNETIWEMIFRVLGQAKRYVGSKNATNTDAGGLAGVEYSDEGEWHWQVPGRYDWNTRFLTKNAKRFAIDPYEQLMFGHGRSRIGPAVGTPYGVHEIDPNGGLFKLFELGNQFEPQTVKLLDNVIIQPMWEANRTIYNFPSSGQPFPFRCTPSSEYHRPSIAREDPFGPFPSAYHPDYS